MPIEIGSGALRLKPSIRVRLHGRSRLPDLAVAFTLATTALFFGAYFIVPADTHQGGARFASQATHMVEMRSAALTDTSLPARTRIRVIDSEIARPTNDWPISTNAH